MQMDKLIQAIDAIKAQMPMVEIRHSEPMKNHTSIKIGGLVRWMILPNSTEELLELCDLLRYWEVVPTIIGNGTNLLVDDSMPLEIIVIKTTKINDVQLTAEREITAKAGVLLSKLAIYAYEHGLSGLEFAHGIPGTLGGAISMNAGAYGMEMKDVVYSTDYIDWMNLQDSTVATCMDALATPKAIDMDIGISHYPWVRTVTGDEHLFSYRHSRFTETSDIILSSVIRLGSNDKHSIKAKMDELFVRRNESQPLNMPNAGSAFKRPKDGYAAAMIEQAGLKGFTIGGAQVSLKHSGFIVNNGSATFADVMAVIDHIKEKVLMQFGVELELEYSIIYEDTR